MFFLIKRLMFPSVNWTGNLYISSDVYSFGVVLLEIVSGRRAFDLNRPLEEQNLVNWAMLFLRNRKRSKTIMDQRLEGQYPLKAVLQMAKLLLKCLMPDPKYRPTMEQVLETLEQIDSLKMKPNDSKSTTSWRNGGFVS
jgi:serine/threonine protein kinase